jgi:hypothetical protein
MSTEIKVEQIKEVVLRRVPPGDRWSPVDNPSIVLESLTDGLEYYFQKKGQTDFFLSAKEGVVEVIHEKEVEVEKSITKYSLYGEH